MPVPYESPSHKESAVEAPAKNKDFIVEDDFHQESTTITEEQYLGGSSFQMPDNFDLPDEIIQEQLPKARYTSTPIRYAKVGSLFKVIVYLSLTFFSHEKKQIAIFFFLSFFYLGFERR